MSDISNLEHEPGDFLDGMPADFMDAWNAIEVTPSMLAEVRARSAAATSAPGTPREYQVAQAAKSEPMSIDDIGRFMISKSRAAHAPRPRMAPAPSYDPMTPTPNGRTKRGVLEIAEDIRNREAAKEIIAAEKRALDVTKPFDAGTIDEILARPAEPEQRVSGLIPWDASTLVVAQRKAGKTTLLGNLAHSLITGDPFLGRFDVQPVTGRVAFLNYEVSAHTAARWFRDMGIPSDRFELVNLRGARNPLGHAGDRAVLAAHLRALNVETVITDPLANAFTGEDQQSNDAIGAFLRDLDRFVREEVGARDNIIAAHAGWGENVRSRGASAMEDWPDSIVYLTKDNEHGDRYLKAFGRDIDVDEALISFVHETRRMLIGEGGSRKETTTARGATQITPAVVAYVLANPGCSQNAIEKNVDGKAEQKRRAAEIADEQGLIERTKVGGRWIHNPPRPGSSHLVPDEPK